MTDKAFRQNFLGVQLYRVGEYKYAIDCFIQTIQIDPNYVEAYTNLSNCLIKL